MQRDFTLCGTEIIALQSNTKLDRPVCGWKVEREQTS